MKSTYFFLIVMLSFFLGPMTATSEARSHKHSHSSTAGDPGGHTNKGVKYARDKEYDKAITEFTKAIDAQPNDPKNYENRALVYKLMGKRDEAAADFRKLIELRGKDASAYANLGAIELQQNKTVAALPKPPPTPTPLPTRIKRLPVHSHATPQSPSHMP